MKRRNFMRFFEAKAHGLHDTSNPLFPRKEAPRKIWPWLAAVFGSMLLVTAAAGIVYGPYLRIRTLEISGLESLSPNDVSQDVREQLATKNWLVLPNSHEWFFQKATVTNKLEQDFPLKSVAVERQGTTLKITVVEDISLVTFRSGEQTYWLNLDGQIVKVVDPADTTSGPEVQTDAPLIREKTDAPHAVGDQIFTGDMIKNIITFSDGLRQLGITPQEFVSDDITLPWFTVSSDKDYAILYDATTDADTQLEVLKAVLDQYLTTQDSPPRYIDVRFGTRVYVR